MGTHWQESQKKAKPKCSTNALHVCRMLLPEGVRTYLQHHVDYLGSVQVHETSRATHLLISSPGIRNWRVGNE